MSQPSARPARSRPKIGAGYFGPIPEDVWSVLSHCQSNPQYVSGNFAREFSEHFALAASMGWVSVVESDGKTFSRTWKITMEGAFALRNREHGT